MTAAQLSTEDVLRVLMAFARQQKADCRVLSTTGDARGRLEREEGSERGRGEGRGEGGAGGVT